MGQQTAQTKKVHTTAQKNIKSRRRRLKFRLSTLSFALTTVGKRRHCLLLQFRVRSHSFGALQQKQAMRVGYLCGIH